MIWVLAGTGDSFELIDKLEKNNIDLAASVVTNYGKQKLAGQNIKVIKGELNVSEMKNFIKNYEIDLIIDATHPFAENVSKNIIKASEKTNTKFIRYERKTIDLTKYPQKYILDVKSYKEAAKTANNYEKVFLTIGSNNLSYFIEEIEDWQERIIARILPDWKFIKKARELGFTPANLIGIQGPFSKKLNKNLFEEYKVDVLVTKASGKIGGLETKIKAAVELEIPVIVIRRPVLSYPVVFNDIEKLIESVLKEVKLS